jgi:hypothetical protein
MEPARPKSWDAEPDWPPEDDEPAGFGPGAGKGIGAAGPPAGVPPFEPESLLAVPSWALAPEPTMRAPADPDAEGLGAEPPTASSRAETRLAPPVLPAGSVLTDGLLTGEPDLPEIIVPVPVPVEVAEPVEPPPRDEGAEPTVPTT